MRNIKIERLYNLGDYRNIKLIEEINDLPDAIQFKESLMSKIRYYLLVSIEQGFYKYKNLAQKVASLSPEEALAFLEEEKINTLDSLKEELLNQ